jgi:hypothetical protein
MKIKSALLGLAVSVLMAGGSGMAADAMKGDMKKMALMVPAAELKWEAYAPGSPLQVAPLWGDRSKGDHGMYLKLPANFEAGFHTHTLDYQAVLMQGRWIHTDHAKNSKELSPMSYVMQPGKMTHNDVCKGPEDCILFIYQSGAGDFIPTAKPVESK